MQQIASRKDRAGGFRVFWSSYRAARHNGASVYDSLQFGSDVLVEFQKTGKVPRLPPPSPDSRLESTAERLSRVPPLAQGIAVNAVTVVGVFALRWPVGSALALYWSETLLATLLMVILLLVWRHGRPAEDRGRSIGETLTASFAFTVAHFVFLFFFLAVILPRYSSSDRFERSSFERGLLLIGIVLVIGFLFNLFSVRRATSADLLQRAQTQMQRAGLMHLTIILGMLALAVFGSARAFFAVFSALKVLVDLSKRVA